jgi:N-acetylglucosaminyl-diphospho-decaprenol L-rhamnosyltransferase
MPPMPTSPYPPSLSICIVHWNTPDDLWECLSALQNFPFTLGEMEVIVVDNASKGDVPSQIREKFPQVICIANDTNRVFAEGCNQALEIATGDFLLLLNPDAQVTEGALDKLGQFLEINGGIVAGKLVFSDGTVQKSVRDFPTPKAILQSILKISDTYRLPDFDYTKSQPAPQPMMSCLMFTRTVYKTVGGLDPQFPLYFNDVDWSLRTKNTNIGTFYCAEAVIIHGHGGTTKKARKAVIWESHRALLRFWEKHYKTNTSPTLLWLLTIIVTLGAWVRTGYWGRSLERGGGSTTPESLSADLHRELEREGRFA